MALRDTEVICQHSGITSGNCSLESLGSVSPFSLRLRIFIHNKNQLENDVVFCVYLADFLWRFV